MVELLIAVNATSAMLNVKTVLMAAQLRMWGPGAISASILVINVFACIWMWTHGLH